MNITERFKDYGVDFEAVKAVPIIEVIGPYVALKKEGPEHAGLCPFHQEKSPSFKVNPSKGFYHCFGCGAHGDGVDFIMALLGIEPREAVERILGGTHSPVERARLVRRASAAQEEAARQQAAEDARKAQLALDIWLASTTAAGSAVEAYLRSRDIEISISSSLRFHPSLKHGPTGLLLPAMVAGVQAPDGKFAAVHRTFLLPDGRGKARVSDPKLGLGPFTGNAVRLAPATEILGICEGIETGLSAMQMYGDPVWAACGSNMAGVVIPDSVKHLVVYADNGSAGEAAAEKAAETFHRQGRRVTISQPIDRFGDFNDVLQEMAGGSAAA
jgi:DNA primase